MYGISSMKEFVDSLLLRKDTLQSKWAQFEATDVIFGADLLKVKEYVFQQNVSNESPIQGDFNANPYEYEPFIGKTTIESSFLRTISNTSTTVDLTEKFHNFCYDFYANDASGSISRGLQTNAQNKKELYNCYDRDFESNNANILKSLDRFNNYFESK